jgi:hypothetical protein
MEVHLERQNGWLVVDGQPVTNFYLKVVGECAPADDDVVRWIVEVEGRVLGQRKRRYILIIKRGYLCETRNFCRHIEDILYKR